MDNIEKYKTLYIIGRPNEPIPLLSQQPYKIDLGRRGLRKGLCDISMKLLPKPRIEIIDINPELRAEESFSFDHFHIQLPSYDTIFVSKPTLISTGRKCIFTPIDGASIIDKHRPIKEMCFSLLNFRPINYPFVLEWSEWKISFSPVSSLKVHKDEIRYTGGFMVTHFGKVTRIDETEFEAGDFVSVWNSMYHYFSFSNGLWSTPILPIGFDPNGEVVFQHLQQPYISSMWSDSVRNWFDDNKPQNLEQSFPGFMDLISDESWTKQLKTVVYWYVNSEDSLPSLDTTIILAQAALELLAWHYLVIISEKVTEEEFKSRKFTAWIIR